MHAKMEKKVNMIERCILFIYLGERGYVTGTLVEQATNA